MLITVTFSFSGKCFGNRGQIHDTHKVFFQSISLLVSRNAFGDTHSVPLASLLDFAGKEISGDAFNVERAVILYNMCWFSLKSYRSKDTRYLVTIDTFMSLRHFIHALMVFSLLLFPVSFEHFHISRFFFSFLNHTYMLVCACRHVMLLKPMDFVYLL